MDTKRKLAGVIVSLGLAIGALAFGFQPPALAQDQTPDTAAKVALGKAIFFDKALSKNGNQSCASCHGPEVGFTGPDSAVNDGTVVYEGSITGAYGNRKPPAASYAGDSPNLRYDSARGEWVGGMFWDGRATGAVLGDPLAEQAQGPFLNPMEQALPDAASLVAKMKASYSELFEQVWGVGALDGITEDVYAKIGRSVAAYERSAEVNPFTSKFDKFWDNAKKAKKEVTRIRASGMGGGGMMGGKMRGGSTDPNSWENFRGLGLTDTELQGLAAFNDPNRADCASCHSLSAARTASNPEGRPLFTNFGYDNLGIPKNPENPASASDPRWVDLGLGGFLKDASQDGKFKVPTLRNVDKRPSTDFVKAYGHNGYFKSLSEIVMFYSWRGMMMGGGMMGGGMMGGGGMGMDMFPAPEVNRNLAPLKHFSMMDQSNIVAFLKTLSDGYFVR